ncbi:unnamed protein product [Blepharisma stoltei]|uniref:Uncharacterized protein n=1 Tax=Blepharisma stoltei TaxID=1481888 RepID=A0AAU9K8L2_9CILI|nr:unnamed protein product [Blepharisma stoltei]
MESQVNIKGFLKSLSGECLKEMQSEEFRAKWSQNKNSVNNLELKLKAKERLLLRSICSLPKSTTIDTQNMLTQTTAPSISPKSKASAEFEDSLEENSIKKTITSRSISPILSLRESKILMKSLRLSRDFPPTDQEIIENQIATERLYKEALEFKREEIKCKWDCIREEKIRQENRKKIEELKEINYQKNKNSEFKKVLEEIEKNKKLEERKAKDEEFKALLDAKRALNMKDSVKLRDELERNKESHKLKITYEESQKLEKKMYIKMKREYDQDSRAASKLLKTAKTSVDLTEERFNRSQKLALTLEDALKEHKEALSKLLSTKKALHKS